MFALWLVLTGCAPSAWTVGDRVQYAAVAARSTSVRDTPIGHPDGSARDASDVRLSLFVDCTVTQTWPVKMACSIDDAAIDASPGARDTDLLTALQWTEARLEQSAIEVRQSRRGRLIEVRAYESVDGSWVAFDALSRWVFRALSPLDTRFGRARFRLSHPAVSRLFGARIPIGLVLRGRASADRATLTGAGRWTGDPTMDVTYDVTQTRQAGRVLAAAATVRGTVGTDEVYALDLRVHTVEGDHRPFESRVTERSE